jgi:RNA-directed DNA polymerase
LRQRIFTASRAGDLPKVRRLQKLMLRSRANTLVSVRRVTERNAGRLTAGVDGEVALTPQAKAGLPQLVGIGAPKIDAEPRGCRVSGPRDYKMCRHTRSTLIRRFVW